jgi:UDP-glucose 4-epimerase
MKNNITIGITGADGFIGKQLSQVLEDRGFKLIKYDLNNFDLRNEVNLSDKIDVLYHLAAVNKPYFSKLNPAETFKTNVLGTLNLLEAARKSNVKKIIFASSILVYKDLTKTEETDPVGYNGIYPYNLEKIIGEEYIKIYSDLFGIDYLIFRISGVYGPGMCKNPIFDIIQGLKNNKIKLYINKNSVYNFIYIDDVISALIKALDWKNDTINLCSDENLKIIDICDFLKNKTDKKAGIEDGNLLIKILGNNDKIKKKGWEIKYPFKKGLINTYERFKI